MKRILLSDGVLWLLLAAHGVAELLSLHSERASTAGENFSTVTTLAALAI